MTEFATDRRRWFPAGREAYVATLPRRTAHAAHALLVAGVEQNAPATVGEVIIYDGEATTTRHTAAALRGAARAGLAVYVPPRYWTPTQLAQECRAQLEERYLADEDAR